MCLSQRLLASGGDAGEQSQPTGLFLIKALWKHIAVKQKKKTPHAQRFHQPVGETGTALKVVASAHSYPVFMRF